MERKEPRSIEQINADLLAAYEERDQKAVIAQQAQHEFNLLNEKIAQLKAEKESTPQN